MSSRSPAIATAPGADGLVRRFIWAGYLLGFARGGFFDGILLHQILQWHHLLMYVIAVDGLWTLWSARRERGMPGDGRLLLATVLIGFGTWHVVDGVVSHWLLGIHRIRMESPRSGAASCGHTRPARCGPCGWTSRMAAGGSTGTAHWW